ncbi:MAG: RelA/SpoT domain-containing protein [Syntrophobacteraceae bacterium]
MDEIRINQLTDEYKENFQIYHDLCVEMQHLLIYLLANNGYKYQICHRIKSIESLRNKIIRKATKGIEYNTLNDINDLAGIRIIFYLESDKKQFIRDLYKELTPQNLRLVERNKEKGYRATHIIAEFGEKRLILTEYRRYASLKCEIQLTSALYHAWSEIEHDIFYKPGTNVKKLDQDIIITLKEELEETLTNYIEKASDTFEHVAAYVRNIRNQ